MGRYITNNIYYKCLRNVYVYHCIITVYFVNGETFERIDRTGERNKMDIHVGVTTCNPFERKFNSIFEREYKTTRPIIMEPSDHSGLLPLCSS